MHSTVEVALRVRPLRVELRETQLAWDFTPTTAREHANADNHFIFDRVFAAETETRTLYEESVRESVVRRVSQGYNGTVFAYGQTGSGKTYTMFSEGIVAARGVARVWHGERRREGLVELAIHDLFAFLADTLKARPGASAEVFVSVVEIYNEQLRDLLAEADPMQPPLPLSIREGECGTYVHNAVRQKVHSATECALVVYKHTALRVSAGTAMNEHSSRSHCVVRIFVEHTTRAVESPTDEKRADDLATRAPAAPQKVFSTLNLVDLAGSERVARSGAVGKRMVEGGHINKSLAVLATVIQRLVQQGERNGPHTLFVPYRDSRLTHLLKASLGGNSFTCMLCCISPALESVDESRSTLQFAMRVKRVKNRVMMNEAVSPMARARALEVELRRVKQLLVAQTIYLWSKHVTIRNLRLALQHQRQRGNGDGNGSTAIQQLRAALWNCTQKLASCEAERDAETEAMKALQQRLEEVAPRCHAHVETICGLEKKVKELEDCLEDADRDGAAARSEVELLRAQLSKAQCVLLEKGRGDVCREEELTRLFRDHQRLQVAYKELKSSTEKTERDLQHRLDAMATHTNELEEQKAEVLEANKIQQSYLRRFLEIASLATQHSATVESTDAPIQASEVARAVHLLAHLADASSHSRTSVEQSAEAVGPTRSTAPPSPVQQLQDRITELEDKIRDMDAERDAIVDAKLERMQGLVLRLHAMNCALQAELRLCYRDNEGLFHFVKERPALTPMLKEAGLHERSLQDAMERVRLARPLEKPLGHN